MSPTAVDRLTPESEDAQVKSAVSDCIAYHIRTEGLTQEQAAGKCFGMAREKTKKELAPAGGRGEA